MPYTPTLPDLTVLLKSSFGTTTDHLSCDIVCTILRPEILNVRLVLNEKEAHDSDGSNNESYGSECDSE